jgi:hypothetical protein
MCFGKAFKSQKRTQLMKTARKMKTICASAVVVLSLAAATTQAQVISWSFDQYGFGNAAGGSGLPVPNTEAGVVLAYNWNDSWSENYSAYAYGSGVTVNNLFDNTGTATTTSITYNSYNGYHITSPNPSQDADGSYNRDMLNGFLNAGPATWSPAITYDSTTFNSIPYAQYNIYVYVSDDTAGRVALVSDGSMTFDLSTMGSAEVSGANASLIQSSDTSGLNPSADYVEFTGLTGSSLTLTVTPGDQTPADAAWVGLAAVQIVAVPEPATLALAAIGGMVALVLGRRPKNS